MKVLLVLSFVLSPAQFLLVADEPTKDTVAAEENGSNQEKVLSLPVGKCAELNRGDGKSGGQSCFEHCKALKEFSGGDCVEEMCRCKLDIKDLVQSTVEKSEDRGKKKTAGKIRSRNGVKCKNLIRLGGKIGSENNKGCGVHCRLLNSENKDGRCVEGVCQCTKEIVEEKPKKSEVDEKGEKRCENNEACLAYCREMGEEFNEGRCTKGNCTCSTSLQLQLHRKIPDAINRAVVKCEHKRKSANEEICRSHCEAFSKDHTQGRCVEGICRCGYAVFEMITSETEKGWKYHFLLFIYTIFLYTSSSVYVTNS